MNNFHKKSYIVKCVVIDLGKKNVKYILPYCKQPLYCVGVVKLTNANLFC